MINIIGDSCVASNITLDVLHQEYINPFCWNIINHISFGYLIKNYKNINFNNYYLRKHPSCEEYYLIIDDNIEVLYHHYREDKNCKTIIKKDNHVYFCDIQQYIIEKYKSRLKLNSSPIFIIGSSWEIETDKYEKFEYIINQNIEKYPLIVITNKESDFSYLKKYENEYTKIFKTELHKNNEKLAYDIYDTYKELFIKNDDKRISTKIMYSDKYTKVT